MNDNKPNSLPHAITYIIIISVAIPLLFGYLSPPMTVDQLQVILKDLSSLCINTSLTFAVIFLAIVQIHVGLPDIKENKSNNSNKLLADTKLFTRRMVLVCAVGVLAYIISVSKIPFLLQVSVVIVLFAVSYLFLAITLKLYLMLDHNL